VIDHFSTIVTNQKPSDSSHLLDNMACTMKVAVKGIQHYNGVSTITHGSVVALVRDHTLDDHPTAVRVECPNTKQTIGFISAAHCDKVAELIDADTHEWSARITRVDNLYEARVEVVFKAVDTNSDEVRSVRTLQRFARRAIAVTRAYHKVISVKVPLRNSAGTVDVRVNELFWLRFKHMQFECLRWHPRKSGMYIRSKTTGAYLHRLIMEQIHGTTCWEGGQYTCEHRDHDPTNNQLSNLTLFTKAQQGASKRGHSDSKMPDVKGVSMTATGSYLVECKKGPCHIRKTVKSKNVALMLYNILTRALNGDCAFTNPVDDATEEETTQANAIAHALLSKHGLNVSNKRTKHAM
jgi:hypothetical protein